MASLIITTDYDPQILPAGSYSGSSSLKLNPGYYSIQSFGGRSYIRRGDRAISLDTDNIPAPNTIIIDNDDKDYLEVTSASRWAVLVESGAHLQILQRVKL